ncbi:nucleoside deaminase [Kaistella palustris]|uniref:nucleoside deaminase n=1 Tax=Kaistella palustris TaxID=493376 RepID=UPI00042495C6|nr:nucleoside deaminase [Kaistella palustris]
MTGTEKSEFQGWMKKCLELARIAKARGDSPVASVIVQDNVLIAEGIEGGKTHKDITCHAEIEAVRNAVKYLDKTDLSDCILVTTHEPCIMCSYVIRHHKIQLVVVGADSGEVGGYSSAYPLLLDETISSWVKPPSIIRGILQEECAALKK